MLACLFRYDVIKRLSHGYCPIGPMENAMRAVPSHPIPWDISHGNPIPMDKPVNSLAAFRRKKVWKDVTYADGFSGLNI